VITPDEIDRMVAVARASILAATDDGSSSVSVSTSSVPAASAAGLEF
jgi:hypothetical protein